MAPSKTNLPAIRACLFDMDGLLIDSEDWYTVCTNEVLREYGKPDLPWDIKAQLQGRPGPEAGKIFSEWAQLPISRADFMTKSVALQRKYFPRTQPLPGVRALLSTLQAAHTHIALATSSHAGNFGLKTGHLTDLFAAFPEDNRVLGDDPRIPPGRGKPAPDIYLLALETVNARLWRDGGVERDITPAECLVFEDSVPGVEAGRRAGMQVVWCPHPGLLNEYRGREKEVLAGLTGQHKDEDEGLKTADKAGDTVGGKEERTGERVKGAPGEIDDGWAVLLQTLEGFPYERYGIGVANKL
ncbi:HAD-like domain-containing protein [Cryomyces antarcticus]